MSADSECMALTSSQFEILRQLFSEATEEQKSSFLEWLNRKVEVSGASLTASTLEEFLSHKRTVEACPFCGSSHIVKNGHRNGRQRFICKDCGKTFGLTFNTILFQTKKDLSAWSLYIDCMVRKIPLRKTASICRINLATAFTWRHKILDALTNMMDGITLEGVVECDETYELLSFKGNHKKSKSFQMPRKAHKRGGTAEKRGLLQEQVCVTCGVNLGGKSAGRISNLGKPSCKDLGGVLDGHVAAGSVMVTDSHRGYCKLANQYGASHILIPRKCHVAQGFNIQTVNYYHSVLKGMINIHFKGVATKYLNNYVVWHNLVNFAKKSEEEKEASMRDFVFTTKCVSFWKKNLERPGIPCAA